MIKEESVLRLVHSAHELILCAELEAATDATREKIETLLENMGRVEREWKLPAREEMIRFFTEKYQAEEKEMLVRRVVALISTMPDDVLSMAYEEETDGRT